MIYSKAEKSRENRGMSMMKNMKRGLCAAAALLGLIWPLAGNGEASWQQTMKYGKVAQETWAESDGTVLPGPEGYATITYSYNKNETTEKYFDEKGEPYRMPGGYYGREITRDGKKQITGITYLDAEGKRALNDWGYARIRMDYTSFGEVKFLMYYGERSPVIVPSLGYAGIKTEFRGKTMTRRTFLDEREKPVDSAAGYAVQVHKINKKNQILGISYEHADGSPATCADGWSSCEKTLDDSGREISTKYYTADGRLTDRGAGYAWEETLYTGKNITQVTRYGLEGEKLETEGGYTTLQQEWQEDRVVRECYLNADGQRILNREGIGAVRYGYDAENRVIRVQYEDLNGQPTEKMEGYAGYQDTLGENGRLLRREYLNRDGQKANRAEGYAEVRYQYDEAGQVTDELHYNSDGIQVQ